MNGIEGISEAKPMMHGGLRRGDAQAGSRAGSSDDSPDAGALASARNRVSSVLGSSGFIDLVGGVLSNIRALLKHRPVTLELEDLKPGVLVEVGSWVASELAYHPDLAENAQARVRPEAAIKLLT